jgi:hypothetical protein
MPFDLLVRSSSPYIRPLSAIPLSPEAKRSNRGNGIVVKLLSLGDEDIVVASARFGYIIMMIVRRRPIN